MWYGPSGPIIRKLHSASTFIKEATEARIIIKNIIKRTLLSHEKVNFPCLFVL